MVAIASAVFGRAPRDLNDNVPLRSPGKLPLAVLSKNCCCGAGCSDGGLSGLLVPYGATGGGRRGALGGGRLGLLATAVAFARAALFGSAWLSSIGDDTVFVMEPGGLVPRASCHGGTGRALPVVGDMTEPAAG